MGVRLVELGAMAGKQDGETTEDGCSSKPFCVGMVVGVSLAGALNPYDQALYLSILHKRPFLLKENWLHPWEGFRQAVVVRTLSGGLFFPLFDVWHGMVAPVVSREHGSSLGHIAAGQLTGATTALLMNPLNSVKHRMWGQSGESMRSIASQMWRERGAAAFTNGMRSTVIRDSVFGATYAGVRGFIAAGGQPSLAVNVGAASAAAALSSPLNYARNMQFGVADGQAPPTMGQALRALNADVAARRKSTASWSRAATYAQMRLGLGWGTLRVGLGMGLGQQLYDFLMVITP